MMGHVPNEKLVEGTYRIVCLGCKRIYCEGEGDLTKAALEELGCPEKCEDCHGEVVLETNPIPQMNTYDASHLYPNHH